MNIREHNKEIKRLRKSGELPPFGMTVESMAMAKLKQGREDKLKKKQMDQKERAEQSRAFITENGSILPNKFTDWGSTAQIDRPTPLLDGKEYITFEGFRVDNIPKM